MQHDLALLRRNNSRRDGSAIRRSQNKNLRTDWGAVYLAGLNSKQREAVEYGIKPGKTKGIGPLLVIAGAGTGKTKTLGCRAGHLLANGADPESILLLKFSRRAAKEMTQRAQRIAASVLKTEKIRLPWAGTFHFACSVEM